MIVNEEIRKGVIESLPETKLIGNKLLRERVYDAWAISLKASGFKRIEDIPASGVPDSAPLKSGTQADHLRSVARLSVQIAEELKNTFKQFDVNMDEVIAGGLCHDLGKPFEFDSKNQARWKADPRKTGFPSIRHSVYGLHVALSAGLPENIAHIAVAHSKEGEYVRRSVVAEIVHRADLAFWRILASAGLLEE